MPSTQEPKASTAKAFEAFGQQFLAQFGPLPSNRKRKAKQLVGGPPKKRRKEPSPEQVEEIDLKHSDNGSNSSGSGSDGSSDDGRQSIGRLDAH